MQLAQVITSGSQTSVDFSSISQAYTSLRVEYLAQYSNAGTSSDFIYTKVNNDGTGSNYTTPNRMGVQGTTFFSNSAPASSGNGAACGWVTQSGSANRPCYGVIEIEGYTSTAWHKFLSNMWWLQNTGDPGAVAMSVATWKSTAAVNQLTFVATSAGGVAFINGSIFTLYGKA